jgi:Family of unknown function (DUF5681)
MPFKKGKSGNSSGRPRGSKNKVDEDLRASISNFLSGEFDSLRTDFKKMNPKDKMKFFTDLLPYAIPRLQNTSLEMDFERLSDDELDTIIESLKADALKNN